MLGLPHGLYYICKEPVIIGQLARPSPFAKVRDRDQIDGFDVVPEEASATGASDAFFLGYIEEPAPLVKEHLDLWAGLAKTRPGVVPPVKRKNPFSLVPKVSDPTPDPQA